MLQEQIAEGIDVMAKPDPVVSIIVVSWNTKEMTLEALRTAIEETVETPYEMIVVDNASEDGSADAIADAFPDLDHFLPETANHGFAKGNNIAAKYARGEYLLLLNPDTVTLDGAIDKLMAFARAHPEAKIWGGKTLMGDKTTLNPTSIFKHITLWSVFTQAVGISGLLTKIPGWAPEAYTPDQYNDPRPVDIVSGCFFLIRRDLWEKLDGFDLDYIMYADEADLCQRAKVYGAQPMYTPDATIVHYLGASSTVKVNRLIMLMRARASLVLQYFRPGTRKIGVWLMTLSLFTKGAAYSLLGRVAGRASWRENGAGLLEVFRRRGEWMKGYPRTSKS